MAETTPPNPADAGLEVRTYFVRDRHALLARVDLGELFVDYYLHLSTHQIKVAPEHDAMFKRALAGFVLHCASRPWNEYIAWTINFQAPLVNLFLTADNGTGAITGRVFDENVKEGPQSLFTPTSCGAVSPSGAVRSHLTAPTRWPVRRRCITRASSGRRGISSSERRTSRCSPSIRIATCLGFAG